jgi:hypothetical protein
LDGGVVLLSPDGEFLFSAIGRIVVKIFADFHFLLASGETTR